MTFQSAAAEKRAKQEQRRNKYEAEREEERHREAEAIEHERMVASCDSTYTDLSDTVGEETAAAIRDFVLAMIRR